MTEIEFFRYEQPAGFVDPASCDHANHEPVYAVLRAADVKVGDVVEYANGGRPVARICIDCGSGLETGWGCTSCDWQEVEPPRMLCELMAPPVEHVLVRPCKEHA